MASDSSANAGSKTLSGNASGPVGPPPPLARAADSRKEDLDEGRRGVVGRDVREREVERARWSEDMVEGEGIRYLGSETVWFGGLVVFELVWSCARLSRVQISFVDFQKTPR